MEEEEERRRQRRGTSEAPAPAPVETVHVVKRKRGRPKGSKNKTTLMRERLLFDVTNRDSETKDEKRTVAEEEPDRTSLAAPAAGVVKRGRGRPKGSKNKRKNVSPRRTDVSRRGGVGGHGSRGAGAQAAVHVQGLRRVRAQRQDVRTRAGPSAE